MTKERISSKQIQDVLGGKKLSLRFGHEGTIVVSRLTKSIVLRRKQETSKIGSAETASEEGSNAQPPQGN